jgi:hypothetical protein
MGGERSIDVARAFGWDLGRSPLNLFWANSRQQEGPREAPKRWMKSASKNRSCNPLC